jgi:hypothetical protein
MIFMVVVKPFNVGGLYAAESVYGTPVTASTAIGRLQNISLSLNNNPLKSRGLGAGRNVIVSSFGPLDCKWTFDQEFNDGEILKLAVGPRTGSGTAGSPYTLTEAVAVSTTDLPFFTLEQISNDTTYEGMIMSGCVADSLTLSFAVGSAAKLSMSGVGYNVTSVAGTQAYTEVSTKPWVFHQITVKWGAGLSALGRVVSGSFTMDNKIVSYRSLGSRLINQPEVGLKDYTFSLVIYMSETSYQTLRTSLYGGGATPDLGIVSAAMPITDKMNILFSEGVSAGNRNLLVQLDECILDSLSEPVSLGSGIVQVTFSGHAHKGVSNQPVKYWTV